MKAIHIIVVLAVAVALPVAAGDTVEDNSTAAWGVVTEGGAPGTWQASRALLFDNGPFMTHSGTGVGGADESWLQTTSLGMSTLGFGAQLSAGYRIADQFVIPAGDEWQIDNITFFAYQSFSPSDPSSLTGVNLQIWDGAPNAGGSVVWGDTSTNIMASTAWTNVYRVTEDSTGTSADRAIHAAVCTVGTNLTAGTYWLDWQFDGSSSYSGPWAPPITIVGNDTTGDALQYTGTWDPVSDGGSGTPQGFPFIVDGVLVGQPTPTPPPGGDGAEPIPTLSMTGIALLCLLLIGVAVVVIRRRS